MTSIYQMEVLRLQFCVYGINNCLKQVNRICMFMNDLEKHCCYYYTNKWNVFVKY